MTALRAGWVQAYLRRHRVAPTHASLLLLVLLLHVLLVDHVLLLFGRETRVRWHGGAVALHSAGWRYGRMAHVILRRIVIIGLAHAVLIFGWGLGSVEAGLGRGQQTRRELSCIRPTWMRFFPSLLVTKG